MSATTLEQLLKDFVREEDFGRYGTTTATGSATTLVDAIRFLRPSAGNEWGRDVPVRITSRAAVGGGNITIGSNSFLDDYDPATGTITVSPAFDDTAEVGAGFIVLRPGTLDHTDRLVEALNRFLERDAEHWERVPFTFVPNGDYQADTTVGWTVNGNAVVAYLDLAHPDGWYQRVLKLTGGTTGQRVASTTIGCNPGEVWNLALTMHVGAAGNVASIVVQNETAGTPITPTFSKGAASTSSLAPVETQAQFTIPAGCTQLSFRPTVGASAQVGYFGPIIAAPVNTTLYTGQTALEFLKQIAGLWTFTPGQTGPMDRRWQPVEYARHDDQLGWGFGLRFETAPPFPLFADMLLSYPPLTAGDPTAAASGSAASESSTTACPEPLALAGMAVEVYSLLHTRDAQKGDSQWLSRLNDARESLAVAQSAWGAPKRISVRKHFGGRASA